MCYKEGSYPLSLHTDCRSRFLCVKVANFDYLWEEFIFSYNISSPLNFDFLHKSCSLEAYLIVAHSMPFIEAELLADEIRNHVLSSLPLSLSIKELGDIIMSFVTEKEDEEEQ